MIRAFSVATGGEMSHTKIATINRVAHSSNYSRGSVRAPLITTLHTVQHGKGTKMFVSTSFRTEP